MKTGRLINRELYAELINKLYDEIYEETFVEGNPDIIDEVIRLRKMATTAERLGRDERYVKILRSKAKQLEKLVG